MSAPCKRCGHPTPGNGGMGGDISSLHVWACPDCFEAVVSEVLEELGGQFKFHPAQEKSGDCQLCQQPTNYTLGWGPQLMAFVCAHCVKTRYVPPLNERLRQTFELYDWGKDSPVEAQP